MSTGPGTSSRINPPATGWFLGKYKAVFYLNGKEQGSIWFSVVSEKAVPGPAEYRTFTSRANGFSIQYPARWVEGVKGSANVACMFLATPDNSPVASLNVQIVPISGGNDSRSRDAVNLVAQQLIDQITGVLKGRIRKDTWTTAEANTGRELDSEYAYQGANIRQRQFLTYHAEGLRPDPDRRSTGVQRLRGPLLQRRQDPEIPGEVTAAVTRRPWALHQSPMA